MNIIEQSVKVLRPVDSQEAILGMKTCEAAGRNCWRSEGKMTEDSYERFINSLIMRGHESPLEFCDFVFEITTSRDVMAEITRHRLCSFCIESQRYVNEDKLNGIEYIMPEFGRDANNISAFLAWKEEMKHNEQSYKSFVAMGMKNQDARKVLNNSTACRIIMKCNFRELRHILDLRSSPAAYPEMRRMIGLMKTELNKLLPNFFSKGEE